jgi:phage minor structural protein
MYQVNLGDKVLYYPASEDAAIYDTEWIEDIGQAGEFSFKVPPSNPLYAELTQGALVTILKDNREVWRGEIREITKDFANIADVYCLEDLAWLADEFMLPASITSDTYAQRFQAAIDAYNLNRGTERMFQAGIITNVTDTSNCNWTTEYEWSILDCLRNCICKDDGYIRVRRVTSGGTVTRFIDIVRLADYGVMATQPIEYGYNLLDYVKESDYGNLTNVLTPYGDELDTEIYDGYNQRLAGTTITEQTSVSVYGRHAKAVVFDGVTDLTELNNLAQAYLTRYSQPQLTMEVKAVDLADIDGIAEIHIGDSVRIIAPPFAVDQWLYLTEIRRDIQNIDKNTITLSGHVQSRRTLTEQSIGTAEAIKNLPSKASILDAAFKNVLALLNGVDGGYVTFETDGSDHITEIRIANNMDYEQATNCWRWNLGGLAHLSRTYPSDPWVVNVAMDMTGQMTANFIKTGELIANNGVYELDMSTGYVKMQQGEFSGQLKAASGTISDGTGTLSLSGGDLNMTNGNAGGAGLFARKSGTDYYSCWGSVNSAARGNGAYREVPTMKIIEVAQYFAEHGGWA